MCGEHAMGVARIGLQRPVLEQVDRTRHGACEGDDLIGLAMLLKRVRIVGPFELAIDYGESETEPLLIFHEPEYDPSQEPDDEDDV